jgi:hypothetical protein
MLPLYTACTAMLHWQHISNTLATHWHVTLYTACTACCIAHMGHMSHIPGPILLPHIAHGLYGYVALHTACMVHVTLRALVMRVSYLNPKP